MAVASSLAVSVATGATLTPVTQNRSVTVYAYADDFSQSSEDSDARSAADFGPFQETVTALAALPGLSAESSSEQDSEVLADSLRAAGSATASARSEVGDAFATADGDSRFEVTFDLAGAVSHTITGELSAALDGFALIRLTGPAGVVYAASAVNQTVPVADAGLLLPGTYTLLARANGTVFAELSSPDSAFAAYEVHLTVEPAVGAPVLHPSGPTLNLTPNPFRDAARISWAAPVAGPLVLSVHDVHGRRVNAIALPEGGRGAVDWNGRDGRGRSVPAGIYFIRLEGGIRSPTVKAVVIR